MSVEQHNALADQFNFAQYVLEQNISQPNKTAYIDDNGSLTYGELDHQLRSLAAALLQQGVMRDQRVLMVLQDSRDFPITFLAAMYAGCVPVAVNTLLTVDDYIYMLEHSRAAAVVVSDALLDTVQQAIAQAKHKPQLIIVSGATEPQLSGMHELADLVKSTAPLAEPADTSPDDMGFWLYSSGSTGRPKGTVHTHGNPYWTAKLYGNEVLGISEDDVCFSAAKLFFAYGLGNGLTFPLCIGATVVLMAERPTPEAVFKRWVEHQPTIFFGAPTGYAGMLSSPLLPSRDQLSLRLASSAGEALPAELGERFTDHFGIEIIDGIGSTEMLHIFLSNRPGKVRYGTTGWPVPGYDIKLVGDDGDSVADGDVGDLYINGPSSALMYWANREKSNETFRGAWTKSGDKYIRNADGSYTYSGRSDDMIKVSGIYVSPFEVEATLIQCPAVLETAVIGVENDQGLTVTKAYIVLKEGASAEADELKAFVKERLAPYKYPRQIEFIDELPKTATGKIQRFMLRKIETVRSEEKG